MKKEKMILAYLLVPFIVIALQSCNKDDGETSFDKQKRIDNELIVKYLDDNDITSEKGVGDYYYTVIKANDKGTIVEKDDILAFYYRMSLLNGEHIDSITSVSDKPIVFKNSNKITIPTGLSLGASEMKEGEQFRFFIPSHIAFGTYSYDDIFPSNSIFVVDFELVQIRSASEQKVIEKDTIDKYIVKTNLKDVENLSSSLYYQKLKIGNGDKPKDGQTVKVHYVGKYLNGTVFDSTKVNYPFSFRIGNNSVIKGFEEGVKQMQKGEKARLIMSSDLAYQESVLVIPDVVRTDLIKKKLIRAEKTPPFSTLI